VGRTRHVLLGGAATVSRSTPPLFVTVSPRVLPDNGDRLSRCERASERRGLADPKNRRLAIVFLCSPDASYIKVRASM